MTAVAKSEPTLVCIGNLAIDATTRDGVRSEPAIGGDAVFAALAARLHMEDVQVLAPMGNDFPASVLEDIRRVGVVRGELPRRDIATLRHDIHYNADGSRAWEMHSSEEEFDQLSIYPSDVSAAALSADGLIVAAMSLNSQLELTPWLRENSGARIYLDLREDYLDSRDELLQLLKACDVFLPSEVEAVALAQTDDLTDAARFFASLGPSTVVIKRAEQGSLVLTDDVVTDVGVEAVEATDSTGAGDAFCGAFAAVHLLTNDALQAAEAGSRAARLTIQDYGIFGLLAALTESAQP